MIGGFAALLFAAAPQTLPAQTSRAAPPGELGQKALTPLAQIAGIIAPTTAPTAGIDDAPLVVRELYQAALDLVEEQNLVLAELRFDEARHRATQEYYELLYHTARVKLALRGPRVARNPAERAAEIRPAAADIRYLLGEIEESSGNTEAAIANFRTATLAADRELNNPHVTAAWFRLATLLERRDFLTAAHEAYTRFDDAIWGSHVEHRNAPAVAAILARKPSGAIEARVQLLEQLGRADEAVAACILAETRQPGSPELARRYVRALLAANRAEEALAACRKRLASAPPSEAQSGGGEAAGAFLTLAIEAAQAADALEPWVAEVVADVQNGRDLELASAMARQMGTAGASASAVRLLTALHAREPDSAATAWALGLALRTAHEHEQSFHIIADVIRAAGNERGVPGEALLTWMNSATPPRGLLEAVSAAGTRGDRDFATNFTLGTAAAAVRQPALAEELLRACLDERPSFAPAEAARGQLCLIAYRWDEAEQRAAAALQHAPGYALALLVRAESLSGRSEDDAAVQVFKEAIRAAPQEAVYRLALAAHSRRTGDLTAAQRYYQEALSVDSSSAAALEGAIETYVAEQKLDLARRQLEQAEQCSLPEDSLRRARTTVRYADALSQDEHLAELARQMQQHPDDGETSLKLAQGLLARGRFDDAAAAVEQAARLLPEDERTLSLMGLVRAAQFDYDRSIVALEVLAQRYPNRESTLELLAEVYLGDFRLEEGRAVLRRLAERAAVNDEKRERLLKLHAHYESLREFDAALSVLDEVEKLALDVNELRPVRLRTLRLAGRYREALDAAAAWLDAAADEPLRRSEFIKCAIAAGAFDAALQRARAWHEAAPQDVMAVERTVRVLLAARRPDEALALLDKFRPSEPEADYQRRMLLAECKAASGKFESALAELDALLAERMFQRTMYVEAGRTLLLQLCMKYSAPDAGLERLDRWEQAAQAEGGDVASDVGWLLRRRGLLSAANRNVECIAVMERLHELFPQDTGLNNDLGYSLIDRGEQVERATGMVRRAVALAPLNAAFLDSYGWALYKSGDFAGAEKFLARCVRLLDGQDAVLYDHLGDAQHRLGKSAAAKQSWQKSIELIERDAERIARDENENESLALPVAPELLAQVRAKLAALERGAAPKVAPLAGE